MVRLDVPRPVQPGGYQGMDFQLEVLTAGQPAPEYVWARSTALAASGFRDLRGRPREYRAQRLFRWLLDRALTFTVADGAALDLRVFPLDPDRADHLPYVAVPVVDPAALGAPAPALLSGEVPLPALPPGYGLRLPRLVVLEGRFWGPFLPGPRGPVPDPEGLGSVPWTGDDTEVFRDGSVCFVRQDRYERLLHQVGTLARAEARARRQVVGTAATRGGRPELRPIARLYEGWCLVQLVDLLIDLGWELMPGRHAALLAQARARALVPDLPAGAELRLGDPRGRQLRLVYDGELAHTALAARGRREELYAATPHNRPDYRLELLEGQRCVRALILDAKRRRLSLLWDEGQYLATMQQLHSYAFGIRHREQPLAPVVRGAIALFSGTGADPAWLELEGGSVILARLAPQQPNPHLRARLQQFLEEG